MAKITWKCASGEVFTVQALEGLTLMAVAKDNNVDGIYGDCGGNLACATCHVVVPAEWAEKIGQPNAMEEEMLDIVEAGRTPSSRLSCQIVVTEELDGLILEVPSL